MNGLDLSKIADRKRVVVSTAEALRDVTPFQQFLIDNKEKIDRICPLVTVKYTLFQRLKSYIKLWIFKVLLFLKG